jgi:AcrR family transcriptional regulator
MHNSDAVIEPARKKKGRRPDKALAALRAALLTLLEQQQFDEITARAIIQEARISPATFYRHYRTKSDLLDAVAESEINTVVQMSAALIDKPREAAIAQLRYLNRHKALWSVLLNGGAAKQVREGFIRRLSEEYADARWESETWLPREVAILFSVTVTIELVSWWLRQHKSPPIEAMAQMLEQLVIRPTRCPEAWAEPYE